jgi:hypothetical protein
VPTGVKTNTNAVSLGVGVTVREVGRDLVPPNVATRLSVKLGNFYQGALATALKEGLVSVSKEVELHLEPPKSFVCLLYFGYLTGIVGTGIWGYGDLLIRRTF